MIILFNCNLSLDFHLFSVESSFVSLRYFSIFPFVFYFSKYNFILSMENNNSNNNDQNTPTLEQQIDDLYRKIKGYENEYAETTNKKEKNNYLHPLLLVQRIY